MSPIDEATASSPFSVAVQLLYPSRNTNPPRASTVISATTQTQLPPIDRTASSGFLLRSTPILLLVCLLAFLYGRVAVKLVSDWYDLPDSSHGFLIPFFVLFLLWDRRNLLRATPTQPSWSGIPLIALALLVFLTGVFGADLFLARLSFVLLTAGLVWTLLGSAMLLRLRFPLLALLLAIPLPVLVMNELTFPLQMLASSVASTLLPLAGVPVLRDGNVIQLPAMQLEVAEACSGIRSLTSLFTASILFGYFLERATWRRAVLAFASIPIAVAANALRIVGTGLCVQYWNPEKAVGFFHEFSGWLMFLVALVCLYFVHVLLRLTGSRSSSYAGGPRT